MKYPAELAVESMEKQALAFLPAIPFAVKALLALGSIPLVTRGINWLSGYDPSRDVQKAQQAQQLQQLQQMQPEQQLPEQPVASPPPASVPAPAPAPAPVPAPQQPQSRYGVPNLPNRYAWMSKYDTQGQANNYSPRRVAVGNSWMNRPVYGLHEYRAGE
jgi:hypothetical protein